MTLKEFKPEGVTGPEHEDMFYRSYTTGPAGAHYELFKEQHHDEDDIKKAKSYIRNNFDPVSIHFINETTL
jgi:hypothetical protein